MVKIQYAITFLRGKQVLLDFQLAELYGVETKRLNEAVKRNIQRFPEDFMFRINREELANIRSHLRPHPRKVLTMSMLGGCAGE